MILKGKLVKLRKIKISDASRFVKWFGDKEVNKFTTRRKLSLAEEKKWIKGMPKHWQIDRIFAIVTIFGIHIGSIGLHKIDKRDKNASYGIVIGDNNYWQKGYGTDASRLILDYGFNVLKMHRIYLRVYDYNKRAIEVYKNLGFKLEGKEREHNFYNNKFHDVFMMGLLRHEWQKAKRKLK